MSGWTTPSVSPAATPASIALPPAHSTHAAASEASAWPAATAQRVPMTWTVEVGAWRGACCGEETESRLIVGLMIRARAPPSQAHVLRSDREATADRRLDLVHRALTDDVPLFAICRGVQVVNVALGGSLYQDIADEYRDAADSKRTPLRHSQTEPRDQPTHPVKVLGEGTRLAAIVGALELAVNSMHHQAIKTLGRGLREVAWAPDGIVEGVERADGDRLVVGAQWHPEELVARDPVARSLFAALVGEARRRASRSTRV